MKVALLAIQNAGDKGNDRQAVIDAFFKIKDRDSVLGKYSIDQNGDTTLSDYGADKRQAGSWCSTRSSRPRRGLIDLTAEGRRADGPPPSVATTVLGGPWKPPLFLRAPPAPPRAARRAGLNDNILLGAARRCASLYFFASDPKQTLDDVKTGLSNGTIWALIALGYTLVYGIIELINFAHGEVFMIGSFISVSVWETLGVTPDTPSPARRFDLIGLVAAMLASGVAQHDDRAGRLPAAAQRAEARAAHHRDRHELHPAERRPALARRRRTTRPTSSAPRRTTSRSSACRSSTPTSSPSSSPCRCSSRCSGSSGSTKYGKAMRATAQDPDAARLMGINVDRTISLTFMLGGLLAGAAGMIYALYNGTIQFNQGFTAGLIAFTAAVMGGIGNLKGAVVGGLIIGVIQSISDTALRPGVDPRGRLRDPDPGDGVPAAGPLRRGDARGMTARRAHRPHGRSRRGRSR